MDADERLAAIKECVERWASQQGHNSCWDYPEVFRLVADLCHADLQMPKHLPPRKEYEAGCKRHQDRIVVQALQPMPYREDEDL